MDDLIQSNIDGIYEKLVARLKGGMLYGVPVDMANPKTVAVAAYFMAQQEWTNRDSFVSLKSAETAE
jgi:hypothetical protein